MKKFLIILNLLTLMEEINNQKNQKIGHFGKEDYTVEKKYQYFFIKKLKK